MGKSKILALRRQARADKCRDDDELMALHCYALRELANPENGPRVLRQALSRVQKWENNNLCHPRYVAAWRRILSLPIDVMELEVLRNDDAGLSLRQNSPFGFLVKAMCDSMRTSPVQIEIRRPGGE
jgi:hypothetical protein